jgi:hypothetical protein
MVMTTYNDARETHRQAYDAWFEVRYSIRRNVHFYILALMAITLLAPAAWYFWLPMMGFLYVIDTDRKLRMQDPFGRGKGPYIKKKVGKSGSVEEWSVISTPSHRGGNGIWPLGNNMYTNEEIWASDDYVRTHAVLSGTTGSGKTVTMSSTFIYVAMISDSGVIMIDGKADPKTWFELYALAVASGRTDDFLVLNFVVGQTQEAEFSLSSAAEKELWEEFQSIESNTFNIFGTGTSDSLFEIGSALLGAEASGDNKMWVERAEALLRSLLKALVDLRDLGQLKISIATLQEYMSLEKLSELEANEDISEIARQQVGAVLNEIAGYRDAMKIEDPQKRAALLADQPSKQFAFLHMQFGALYAMLVGTYGHIANVEYSDIWAPDVIRNRRIMLVMLPALEKAPTSLAQLGRMATSAIKSALAQNISGSLTGRKSELVDRRPTNSTRAMVLIYDEAASYIQAGTADVASQSRSLGAFNIFSSQEWGSFKQAGEIEAQRIISNTGLKIVLKNEDKDTADQFMAAVGEAPILKSGGKRHENGKLVENEQRLENVPRVTFQEMMNLAEGQAYIKWRDTLIHVRMPFVPNPEIKSAQRNDLVPIPGSMTNDRVKMRLNYERANDVIHSHLEPLDLVQGLVSLFEREEDKDLKPQYALFEKIVRSSYEHQVVIPWKEAPPPRGKVKATEIYTFTPEQLAPTLTLVMERSKDHPMIGRLIDLHEKPDDRFAMPFMPHEAGMVDGGFDQDPDVAEAREKLDDLESGIDEISSLLDKNTNEVGGPTTSVEGDNADDDTEASASESSDDEDAMDLAPSMDDFNADEIEPDDAQEDAFASLSEEDDDSASLLEDAENPKASGSSGGFGAFLAASQRGEEEVLADDDAEELEPEPGTKAESTINESDSDSLSNISDDILGALGKQGMVVKDLSIEPGDNTPDSEQPVPEETPPATNTNQTDTTTTAEGFKSLIDEDEDEDEDNASAEFDTLDATPDDVTGEFYIDDDDLPFGLAEPDMDSPDIDIEDDTSAAYHELPDNENDIELSPQEDADETNVVAAASDAPSLSAPNITNPVPTAAPHRHLLQTRHDLLAIRPREPFDIKKIMEQNGREDS